MDDVYEILAFFIIVVYGIHQRVVFLEMSGEVHRAGSFLMSYVCNALCMCCCSMPPMRYSAVADGGRPASTWELTCVDLVIHVAMAAATHFGGT